MDVSRRERFGGVKVRRVCGLTFGLSVQGVRPAGPDGIRG